MTDWSPIYIILRISKIDWLQWTEENKKCLILHSIYHFWGVKDKWCNKHNIIVILFISILGNFVVINACCIGHFFIIISFFLIILDLIVIYNRCYKYILACVILLCVCVCVFIQNWKFRFDFESYIILIKYI